MFWPFHKASVIEMLLERATITCQLQANSFSTGHIPIYGSIINYMYTLI